MAFAVFDRDTCLDTPLGGKARALASLRAAELPVPPWFVVTSDAFHASLTLEQAAALQNARDAVTLRGIVENVLPSLTVEHQVRDAVTALCHSGEFVAVRSSASDEDGAQHSFAGQLDSF